MEAQLGAVVHHDGDPIPTVVDRVWVAKNMTEQNVKSFENFFKTLETAQNQEKDYIRKHGAVQVESLPIEAHKKILTNAEKKRKKREYNIKRNQKPDVKKQRKENSLKPENIKKREEANKKPENKKKKTLSGKSRRRALNVLQELDAELYEKVHRLGIERVKTEEEGKVINDLHPTEETDEESMVEE